MPCETSKSTNTNNNLLDNDRKREVREYPGVMGTGWKHQKLFFNQFQNITKADHAHC